jgi:hypothetical protein
MNIDNAGNSILRSLSRYLDFLRHIDEEQFQRSPSEGVWSYSEVYSHIISSDTGSLIAIERCMNDTKSSTGRMQWQAWLILFFGVFPPGKIKAPVQVAAMVKKIRVEEARDGIIKLKERIPEILDLVRKSLPGQKVRHPRLGLLNARQWLRFIDIHTLHHLKQLQRINAMLIND